MKLTCMTLAALILGTGIAAADTHEVKMLNRGAAGAMVFEPAFVKAEVGDVIRFVATDRGHNVETIDGMIPAGTDSFKTAFNADYEMTVEAPGVYGVKCTPHYAMGMVALIQAGEPANLDTAAAVTHKGKAKDRMAELLAEVQ